MPSTEQLLIAKIIEEQDLGPVAEAGIEPDYFLDAKNRAVFARIVEYAAEYSTVPTLRAIRKDYPNYKFDPVPEPWQALTDEVRWKHDLHVLEEAMSEAVEVYDSGTKDDVALMRIKALFHHALTEIEKNTVGMKDTNLALTAEERLVRYQALADRQDNLLGIPSGFDRIDQALQGFQPGQLIIFVGPPKAGKSTMMLLSAIRAHLLRKKPLVIGFEMSNEEQEQRVDAITARISHSRLRTGELTKDEWDLLKRRLHSWDLMADFFLSNDTMSTTNLTGVAAKVDKYQPDILIVDGMYMMQDENGEKPGSPQAITNLTRGFKRLCQNKNIPTIITTQVLEWKMDKKHGVTSTSIGYSSSFSQDGDAIIAVENTDDPLVKKIKVLLARNHPPFAFYMKWDWETGEFIELDDDYFDQLAGGGGIDDFGGKATV